MLGYLMDGGWMMLPLVICSVIGFAILIDRARAFRAAGSDYDELRGKVRAALEAGNVDDAMNCCKASSGPVASTLLVGLTRLSNLLAKGKTPEEMELVVGKTMEEYAPKSLRGLEKRLNYLVLIASISPLLGMIGTVTGMINSFTVMAASAGLDPGAVAGGISEALITTAAGLLIAVPCVVGYNVFTRRADDYATAIETGMNDILEVLSEV